MKGFRFSLEPVLEQRKTKEEEALLGQAKALQECVKCQQNLDQTKQKLVEAFSYAGTLLKPEEQLQSFIYREHLQQTAQREQKHLQRAEEIFDLRRQDTMKARQERMVLEKLKEKQLTEFQARLLFLEQKEIDEMATLRYSRKA
ncbi:flagellar export protein FliJ [Desulforamulus aeronauticus]|uniref:Flagellar FliJ protein n=1 Tax=Desulforamulus aeronauticus DSM 10349 TaxID=1121421 RepID=A0A1M6RCY0_9FIRM|nr:flagellar export protein FliJ [Desulforamulus aeronauticus]SHK30197.1 flagellar FliJ protein [Desulforamulus aeronauticus DSM 10349]